MKFMWSTLRLEQIANFKMQKENKSPHNDMTKILKMFQTLGKDYLCGTLRSDSAEEDSEPDCCSAEKRFRVLVVDRPGSKQEEEKLSFFAKKQEKHLFTLVFRFIFLSRYLPCSEFAGLAPVPPLLPLPQLPHMPFPPGAKS